jgi:hypothetical protein
LPSSFRWSPALFLPVRSGQRIQCPKANHRDRPDGPVSL